MGGCAYDVCVRVRETLNYLHYCLCIFNLSCVNLVDGALTLSVD